jgi:hypothetical protein
MVAASHERRLDSDSSAQDATYNLVVINRRYLVIRVVLGVVFRPEIIMLVKYCDAMAWSYNELILYIRSSAINDTFSSQSQRRRKAKYSSYDTGYFETY